MEINLWGEATLSKATDLMFSSIKNDDYQIEHIIIVPDRFSLLAEKKLLSTLKNGILFNIKVTTFSNFAKFILQEKKLNSDMISVGERLLVISKAVKNCKDNFLYFKKSNINFCDKILKTISLLQSSGVAWQDLEKEEKCKKVLKNKLHDIALIYKEYLELLGEKLDSATLLDIAFSQNDVKDIFKNKIVYLAQFDSFTAQMYNSIKFLAENCKSLNISFAKSMNLGNDYIYEKDVEQKVFNIAKELGCQINVNIGNSQKSDIEQAILKSLYSSEKDSCLNNKYQSFSAFSKRQEVENMAKLIAEKIRQGYKYNDFEIAVGGLEEYSTLIDEIFSKYNFSYYIDLGLTANQTIFARCLLSYIEIINSGFSLESLLNFFINPVIKLWNDDKDVVEQIIKYNIDGKWKFEKFFNFNNECSSYIKKLSSIKTNHERNLLIKEFVCKIKDLHSNYIENLDNNLFFKEKNIELQTYEIVEDALNIIFKNEDENEKCNLKEFAKELELLLQSKNTFSVPTLVDGIMVGDATESFFENKKVLYIIGGQSLPKIIGDNSLLSDMDIVNPIYKKFVEPTSKMINRRNRFSLFNLLSSVQEELFISYLQFDDEGNKINQPLFIEQLNFIFKNKTIKFANNINNKNITVREIGCLNNLEKFVLSENNNNKFEKHFKLNEELLRQEQIEDIMFKNKTVSVSQLESYFSCPFKHFARYGLKLKEKEIFKFDQRDVGNLCHKAVEVFVQGIIDKKYNLEHGIVDRFIEEEFDKIIDQEDLNKKLEVLPERNGLEKFLKFQIKTILCNVVLELKNSFYFPKFVEYKIEDGNILKNKIKFVGKIDRIDEAEDYFRILDYKTGHVSSVVKDLYYGDKLQLFLYAKIVRKKLNKNCGGVFYFNCKFEYEDIEKGKSLLKGIAQDDDENLKLFDKELPFKNKSVILQLALSNAKNKTKNYTGRVITKKSLTFYENYAEKVAEKAIEEIKSGYIIPKPDDNSCLSCKYSSICLYNSKLGTRQKTFNEKKFLED